MKTKAPLRISFAGGGTDCEPYASEYGGCVLSGTIDMYAYAEYPSEPHEPSEIESTICWHFDKDATKLKITSEAPPMSGLGGSASCFVAGIKAVRPDLDKEEIANLAYYLERIKMGIAGGKQDQYISALGGLKILSFEKKNDVYYNSVPIPEGFERLLLMVYLGKRNHHGHDIILDQMKRDNQKNFDTQKKIVSNMREALIRNDLVYFGNLLNLAWVSKLRFSKYISTPDIKIFHKYCMKNGAIAGKLTGAGGGGYMLLMEHPNQRGKLRRALSINNIAYRDIHFTKEGVSTL